MTFETDATPARRTNRRALVAGGVALGLALAGGTAAVAMGGGGASTPEGALQKAAQGYSDAMAAGDATGAAKYLAPQCTTADRAGVALGAAMYKAMMSGGAHATVQNVRVTGATGTTGIKLTGNVSETMRSLMAWAGEDTVDEWRLVGGRWYRADC